MKYSDINVGDAVKCIPKYGHPAKVVLDKGKFLPTRVTEKRRISWKGMEVVTQWWYVPAPNLKQSRVITIDVDNSTAGLAMSIRAIPMAGVREVYGPAALAQILSGARAAKPVGEARTSHNGMVKQAHATMKAILAEICHTDVDSIPASQTPYQYLASRPDVLNKMILLWMKYCQQTGQPIGDGDIEPLIDEFRSCVEILTTGEKILDTELDRVRKTYAIDEHSPQWWEPLRVEVLP